MMNTALQAIASKALPALSGEQVTYNAAKNVFLSQGYTSAAGNMYYKAIRLSNRLVVYYDLGQGYIHTFLNGIKLFAWDGQKAQLIAPLDEVRRLRVVRGAHGVHAELVFQDIRVEPLQGGGHGVAHVGVALVAVKTANLRLYPV